MSDLLMGIDMIILAVADVYYNDYFPSFSTNWRNGPLCKLASCLSILSSEASVFLITLITFDRFIGVTFPFARIKLKRKSAWACVTFIWITCIIFSVVPVQLSEKASELLEVSEVCVGVPIVRRPVVVVNTEVAEIVSTDVEVNYSFQTTGSVSSSAVYFGSPNSGTFDLKYKEKLSYSLYSTSLLIGNKLATYFSIVIFIGVNLTCFVFIAVMYIGMYTAARKSAKNVGRNHSNSNEEIRMTVKMSAIVLTDFFTWVPLTIACILVQANYIEIHPVVYAWTVAFIIPINSAINPFLYTLITLIQNKNSDSFRGHTTK